jgi:hypothetical protein
MGMASAYLQKNSTREALESFKSNLTNLIDLVKSLDDDSKFSNANKLIYKLKKSLNSNSNNDQTNKNLNDNSNYNRDSAITSIYWMLQDPVDELKNILLNKTQLEPITNRQIDVYNRAAFNLL